LFCCWRVRWGWSFGGAAADRRLAFTEKAAGLSHLGRRPSVGSDGRPLEREDAAGAGGGFDADFAAVLGENLLAHGEVFISGKPVTQGTIAVIPDNAPVINLIWGQGKPVVERFVGGVWR
jgi:hypothetical protein